MYVDYKNINGALEKIDEVLENLPKAIDELTTDILYSDVCNFNQARAKLNKYVEDLKAFRETLVSNVNNMKRLDNEIEGRSWAA